jgi:hypothetical protein
MSFIANVFASQIFPIYESPTQRLRVKLVGLSKMTSTSNFQSDVQQLGETMEYLATQLPSATKLDLEAYDPSLHFLLKWMQNKEDPPTMHEVLRHPFFITPAERLTFGIALGGGSKLGMIGSYLCKTPHMANADCIDIALFKAVNVDFTKHLNSQLNLMFEETTSEAFAVAGAGVRGVAGGGGAISSAAAEAKATLEPISASDAARAGGVVIITTAEDKAALEPIATSDAKPPAESKTADEDPHIAVRQVNCHLPPASALVCLRQLPPHRYSRTFPASQS